MEKEKRQVGFSVMPKEQQRAIASMGGSSVPPERRSFSMNRELASAAGKKGGQNVPKKKRSFSTNNALAVAAGTKGGAARGKRHGE